MGGFMPFQPRLYDNNAVMAFLARYQEAEREISAAQTRLARLEHQAAKDAAFLTAEIQNAIISDRQRITQRVQEAQAIKQSVLEMLALLPQGNERRALELYYVSGLNNDKIADAMYYSPRAVRMFKERGITLLIGIIKRRNDNGDKEKDADAEKQ